MYSVLKSQSKQVVMFTAMMLLGSIFLFNQGRYTSPPSQVTTNGQKLPRLQVEEKYTGLDAVFKERQNHLKEACVKEGHTPPVSIKDSLIPGRILVETKHQILFCPVQKAGSTFWTKTLIAMTSQGRFSSPYEVGRPHKNGVQRYQDFKRLSPSDLKNWFLEHAVSLLVVRDPYTKLFSAYVDKLYHPNYLFWRITGQPIRNMITGRNDSKCGNDVSFSDFIKYIIYRSGRTDYLLNTHFTPIYKHCDPCSAKYDYIMKFENFKDDFYYILGQWNNRFSLNISFKDFEKETAHHIAESHINISFSTMKLYANKCNISAFNFLQRTWQFLQITGHIPKDIDLPFPNDENASLITKGQLLNAVKDALSHEIDWLRVKEQRHEALVQAYQSVNITDIKKLREIVKPDCVYFGYDEMPGYLFEKTDGTLNFNYFDGLSHS